MSLKEEPLYNEKITKNTDIDSVPSTQDSLISKLQTFYKSSLEQSLSLSESNNFPVNSSTLFSSNIEEENSKLSPPKINTNSHLQLTQKTILNSFTTQRTTMILQKVLFEATKEEIDNVVNELSGKYRQIIKDKNGNYFCSDLFKVCNQKQRIKILEELSNTICDDCINKFGTHAIQTLIEFSSSEEEYNLLLNSFNDYNKILFASIDPNGSYVITKIIEHIPEKFKMKFNLLFVSIFCFICTKKFGVCNAKKFVSCTKNDEIIKKLIDLIKDNFVSIASNEFGNYLIQYMLEKWWNTNEGEEIKEQIRVNINALASNKYAYFIVDLYIKLANREEKIQLIENLKINLLNNLNSEDNSIFMKIMNSLGQLSNNYESKNTNNLKNNNNQKISSLNNFGTKKNIFNNSNQIPLSVKINFRNQNTIINSNQIPISLNSLSSNNNFMNRNQLLLNSFDNNNIMNNLTLNNFNKNSIYYKNNNIRI
jgi:hypothetical protein